MILSSAHLLIRYWLLHLSKYLAFDRNTNFYNLNRVFSVQVI